MLALGNYRSPAKPPIGIPGKKFSGIRGNSPELPILKEGIPPIRGEERADGAMRALPSIFSEKPKTAPRGPRRESEELR